MKYPGLLIIMILIFADYFLTIWGTNVRDKSHSNFFEVETYELNPIWQKDIDTKKTFNIRQITMVIISFSFFIYLFEFSNHSHNFKHGVLGALTAYYGMLTGRHFSNLLTYYFTKNNPTSLSGKVKQNHSFVLHSSIYQYLVAAIPIIIISLFQPTSFTIGCSFGAIFLISIHLMWLKKHKRASKKV